MSFGPLIAPFRRGFWDDPAIMMRLFHRRVASIIPTSMYVMAKSVNAGEELRGFIAGETLSCRDGDLTSGHKMAQIRRFRAIWFRVIIVTGVNARKTLASRPKEPSAPCLPPPP